LFVLQVRAREWLANGELALARLAAEQVFSRSLELGTRIEAVEAALTLATILRAQADPAEASRIETLLATADRLIAETGARNLTPFVHLERAALLTRAEDAGLRRALLERAQADFTRMGANGRAREISLTLNA
jgi:hypothetical protein